MKLTILKRAFFALALIFCAHATQGATITVSTANDSGPGSLRQAIADANVNVQEDTIVFDADVFSTPKTILLTTGELRVLRDVNAPLGITYGISIIGPGPNLLTIDASGLSRIFYSETGILSFSGLSLINGFAPKGGAVYTSNDLIISNSVIADNVASGNDVTPGGFLAGQGGGIHAGGVTISGSTLRNNTATGVGLEGAGAGGAIFTYRAYVIDCTFISNLAKGVDIPGPGVGLRIDGTWGYGGAIYSTFDSSIINSRFVNNAAIGGHGSPDSAGSGGGARGGAVIASGARILNSTFSNNLARGGNGGTTTASNAAGRGGDAWGGAINDTGNCQMANATVVQNMVVAGNGKVGGNALGGGIAVGNGNQWHIINFTITNNTTTAGTGTQSNGVSQGGGMHFGAQDNYPSTFRNNIIAENNASEGPDVFGTQTSSMNNLIRVGDGFSGVTNGQNGNLIGTSAAPLEAVLAPLADNGGVTQTRALLAGSPAIDAGTNSITNPITSQSQQPRPLLVDQRNFLRLWPAGGTVDIGAYEFGTPAVTVGTTAPDLRSENDSGTSTTDNITKSATASFDIGEAIPGARVDLLRDGAVVATEMYTTTFFSNTFSRRLTDPSPPRDAAAQYTVRQTIGGVMSGASAALTVTFDNTGPTGTINQAATQADPTNSTPVLFAAAFSERVSGPGPISFQGSTANVTGNAFSSTTDGGLTYRVEVIFVTSNGQTVVANLGNFQDLAGNPGTALPSTDNSVTLDNVRPGVTINQAPGQADPTNAVPIRYRVVFTEPVSGLFSDDFLFTGSTLSTAAAVVELTGSGTTYDVAVSGITAPGRLRLAVRQGAASDVFQNPNNPSTSADNSVTLMLPTATISGRVHAQDGRGMPRAVIAVTAPDGTVFYSQSNHSGYFRVVNVPTGNLMFTITRKPNFEYTRSLFLSGDLTGFDFGLP